MYHTEKVAYSDLPRWLDAITSQAWTLGKPEYKLGGIEHIRIPPNTPYYPLRLVYYLRQP